ncbi:thiolase family protein [Ruminococcaceae bacterium OttesenSCG-928-O06]|nr:thiolase family protein [Ruminococcaceae bacterium OttesenSCG-928-O06]
MREAVVVSAVRSPMTKYRGALAPVPVPKLGGYIMQAAVDKVGLDPALIDDVVFGNLIGHQWGDAARCCVLETNFPDSVSALTVDRQCSSSLNALALGASMIWGNMADVVLTGGVESYSQAPFLLERPQSAYPGEINFVQYTSSIPGGRGDGIPMIPTAENLAKQYNLTREECDEFAMQSHHNAAKAAKEGWTKDQIVPITLPQRKGDPLVVDADSGIRGDSSMETLGKLRPVMPGGVVTAGNASPQTDGSSAVLVMSREKAEELGLEILAVVKEFAAAGCDPTIMGIGPVYSTRKLMARHGYKLDDFDLIELNEAFAAQSLAVVKELGIDRSRLNIEGGAIAIGHPLAASGGMLAARMVYALRRTGKRRGLVTFCCGGGQGFSLVLENPNA